MGDYDRPMDETGPDSKRKIRDHLLFVDKSNVFIEKITISHFVVFTLFHKTLMT